MKKQLMTTTALAAAGVLATSGAAFAQAGGPTLSLGGWAEGIVAIADTDGDENTAEGKRVGVDVFHDAEIHFRGAATLDNGIKLASRVELEGNVSADQIDEAYVTVTGSFGQFRLGADDNAAHAEVTRYAGTWATQVGQNAALDSADMSAPPDGFERVTQVRLDMGDGDAEKITYFTPRIAGFRFGASYLPSNQEDANSSLSPVDTTRHEGWAATASFGRKFGAVGLGLAAGYLQWKGSDADEAAVGDSDPKGWNVAGRVDIGGFRFAAGYLRTMNDAGDGGDKDLIDVGGRFKWGANNISAGYIHGEAEATSAISGEDETDIVLLSYRRDLGPGVQYRLNLWMIDYSGEDDTTATDESESLALSTSVRLAF